MAVSVAEARPRSNIDQWPGPQWPGPVRPAAVRGGFLGVRAGQVVATQAALAALLAALGRGPLGGTVAAVAAAALVLGTWIRVRRRWLFEWLAVGICYLTRRRRRGVVADSAALLDLVTPAARVLPATLAGDPAAVISDGHGLTALLELGDPAGLLNDTPQSLPAPASLLPALAPHVPPTRIQLLLTAAPAPAPRAGGNHAATSYRQLTDGRVLGHEQAVLAIRVLHTEGWSSEDLLRSLSSILRKVRRRLAPVPGRVLGESAALR
ncbi:MAG TPA: type VII secretion protein EccE, partial [Micromonospora sp.]|nr:type VII secretion protein EccE [Micromonospora sp.]